MALNVAVQELILIHGRSVEMCKYAITIANTDPVVGNLQTPMTQVAVRKATSADAQAIMAHMKRTIAEPGVDIPFVPGE